LTGRESTGPSQHTKFRRQLFKQPIPRPTGRWKYLSHDNSAAAGSPARGRFSQTVTDVSAGITDNPR